MKILIVRHGDPDYTIDSLTETGWKEAELVSRRLTKLDVKNFYCSPMGRARDTASPTLKKLGREAEILPWLREFSAEIQKPYLDKPGMVWDWRPSVWTRDQDYLDRNKWDQTEVFRAGQVQKEYDWVIEGFDALLKKHGYERSGSLYKAVQANEDTIVLFCHFGVECVMLSHLLNMSPMILWHGFCAAPTSVTTIVTEEREEGIASFRILSFGDVTHLLEAGEEPSFAARFCETYYRQDQRHE